MTGDEILKAAAQIHMNLTAAGFTAVRADEDKKMFVGNLQPVSQHLCWMCEQIPTMVEKGQLGKAFRWLGFMQGVYWATGCRTIAQMKAMNRSKNEARDEPFIHEMKAIHKGKGVIGALELLGDVHRSDNDKDTEVDNISRDEVSDAIGRLTQDLGDGKLP